MSDYYSPSDKYVENGDIAFAADLNNINDAVSAGFDQVQVAIEGIAAGQSYYADIAEKWATEVEDTEVDPGRYSAFHWAQKAEDDAADALVSKDAAAASALSASGSASSATSSANSALSSKNAAGVSETNAAASAVAAAFSASEAAQTPVGAIIPIVRAYFTNGSNGGMTAVGTNSAAGLNALYNAGGWYVCNGAALNLVDSPIFNGAGRYLPNLTDARFLEGSTAYGATGGSNSMAHTHNVTVAATTTNSISDATTGDVSYNGTGPVSTPSTANSAAVNVGATTLTTDQMPAHTHTFNNYYTNGNNSLGTEDAGSPNLVTTTTGSTGGGLSHTHTQTQHTHTMAHTHTIAHTHEHSHTHGVPGQTVAATGPATSSSNIPLFMSCIYIMKVL